MTAAEAIRMLGAVLLGVAGFLLLALLVRLVASGSPPRARATRDGAHMDATTMTLLTTSAIGGSDGDAGAAPVSPTPDAGVDGGAGADSSCAGSD
jgi:hypothetical protein